MNKVLISQSQLLLPVVALVFPFEGHNQLHNLCEGVFAVQIHSFVVFSRVPWVLVAPAVPLERMVMM